MAAASLKAPGSPWKATRVILRLEVLIGRRYLAIRGAKPKANIRSGQARIRRNRSSAAVRHSRTRRIDSRNGCCSLLKQNSNIFGRRALARGPRTSPCAGVPPSGIIPSPGERFHHEQTRSERICGLLRELHSESSWLRRLERFGIAANANAAVVRGAKRAGRQLPVWAGKRDGKGSSRTHHGYRAHFCLPGIAVRARRPNAATGIRAG